MVKPRDILMIAGLGSTLAVAACAGGGPVPGVLTPVSERADGASFVQILIGTTRERSGAGDGEMFSGDRASTLSFASVAVSIPPDDVRKVGEIQWPSTAPGDPRRDFVTASANYIDRAELTAAISTRLKQSGRRKVLVFVHGFNNRFEEAVYRFAQIVHDASAPGLPLLFTWPSRGELKLRAYTYDRESANYSRDGFEQFLEVIVTNPQVAEVNVIAHSMGNLIALEALRSLSIRAGGISSKIKNVMLVAPDVDVDVFRTQLTRIGAKGPRFLLFVSQDDEALSLSQTIWGGGQRLGNIDPLQEPYQTELARNKIEVFDLSKLSGDAHGRAFEDITTVMTLIRGRLADSTIPNDRQKK